MQIYNGILKNKNLFIGSNSTCNRGECFFYYELNGDVEHMVNLCLVLLRNEIFLRG